MNNPRIVQLNKRSDPRVEPVKIFFENILKIYPLKGEYYFSTRDETGEEIEKIKDITFVFNKKKTHPSNIVLIPDFHFLDTHGYSELKKNVDSAVEKYPWEKKKSSAIWRGSPTGADYKEIDIVTTLDSSNRITHKDVPRIKFALLAKEIPIIDAGFPFYSNDFFGGFSNLQPFLEKNGILKNFISREEQISYEYLIDVDGNVNSWDGFFWKLYSNSVVFKIMSEWEQWFYDRIKPWFHYIPVRNDMADLEERIEWALANEEKCKEIAINGRDFAKTLTYEGEVLKMAQKLTCLSKPSKTTRLTLIKVERSR